MDKLEEIVGFFAGPVVALELSLVELVVVAWNDDLVIILSPMRPGCTRCVALHVFYPRLCRRRWCVGCGRLNAEFLDPMVQDERIFTARIRESLPFPISPLVCITIARAIQLTMAALSA